MGLIGLTPWQFLLVLSVGIFGTLFVLLKPKKAKYGSMLKLGLFLALFDFAFETWGALSGLWVTTQSLVPLGAVPLEVFLICLMTGATYVMLFPRKVQWDLGVFSSILIACAGALIEAMLVGLGVLTYYGGWTSGHALIGYFATFMILHALNSQV